MKAANILETIGNTAHIRVARLFPDAEVWIKSERSNPGGSIKDRIGLRMIEAAERDGRIRPGGTIVEATAGNTGLGLALAAIHKGYKLLLVIPDKMSQEKIFHLRAMGVEIVMTRSDVSKGHPEYYQDMAKRIRAATPEHAIVSSDCGVFVLPPAVEGFREFMLLLESEGFSAAELRRMNTTNPAALFGISLA